MRYLVIGLSCMLICACAPQDIVLLDLPAAATDDGDGAVARPCIVNRDCPASYMCGRVQCAAPTGRCEPLPLVCSEVSGPICGCDGVTYWNDCVRRLAKVSSSAAGECYDAPALCGGKDNRACPANTYCAHVSPVGVCDPMEPGRCWGMPTTCPTGVKIGTYNCAAPQEPANCVGLCAAIKSELPHVLSAADVCR
jgi:hypothetical protein